MVPTFALKEFPYPCFEIYVGTTLVPGPGGYCRSGNVGGRMYRICSTSCNTFPQSVEYTNLESQQLILGGFFSCFLLILSCFAV